MGDWEQLLASHRKVALQFSGGRDSLAMLLYLRPWWDQLTVYYCNSGDAFPETLALVNAVKATVPHFVEVEGRVWATREQHGMPADVLPAASVWPLGASTHADHLPLINRYLCCALSIMEPLQARMQADGVTLILRGQRDDDEPRSPVPNGAVIEGVQLVYPIATWSTDDVETFIKDCGLDVPAYYAEGMTSAPDCMHCTAWLEHRQPQYLAKHYPDVSNQVNKRIQQIKVVVEPAMRHLDAALGD